MFIVKSFSICLKNPLFRLSSASWWVLRSLIFAELIIQMDSIQLSFDFYSWHVVKFASFHQDNLVGQEILFCIPSWYHLTSTQLTKTYQLLLLYSFPTSFFPLTFQPNKITPKTHTWMASWLLFVDLLGLTSNPRTPPKVAVAAIGEPSIHMKLSWFTRPPPWPFRTPGGLDAWQVAWLLDIHR